MAKLSRSRFYRLAADWRAAPSLAALGTFAGAGASRPRLDPDAVNALQAIVADVVRLNADASVSQQVRLMVERAGVPEKRLPGAIRLRNIVEDERRRLAAAADAGHSLQFDCSAINLPRADGRPHVMFACLDPGTRLAFGWSVLAAADVVEGYRLAAADARARLTTTLGDLPWAVRLTGIQLTAGMDEAASVGLVDRLTDAGIRNVQLARVPKRFGRYFRAVIGDRVGRIAITPARTGAGPAMPDNGDMMAWSDADAAAAVTSALESHNSSVLAGLGKGWNRRPPDDVLLAFDLLADGV